MASALALVALAAIGRTRARTLGDEQRVLSRVRERRGDAQWLLASAGRLRMVRDSLARVTKPQAGILRATSASGAEAELATLIGKILTELSVEAPTFRVDAGPNLRSAPRRVSLHVEFRTEEEGVVDFLAALESSTIAMRLDEVRLTATSATGNAAPVVTVVTVVAAVSARYTSGDHK